MEEGDLDGNKTDEWGYIPYWSSLLTAYELFTVMDGKWNLMPEPIIILRDILESTSSENNIAHPSNKEGFIKIKTSDVIDEVSNWIVVDTIVPVNPQAYSYDLVECRQSVFR